MSDNQPALRTTRDMIRGVADRWRQQYGSRDSWGSTITGNSEDVWNRLAALNVETATPEDVAAIIGNRSGTSLKCDQCGRDVDTVIEFGEALDYESRTADICLDCFRLAAALVGRRTEVDSKI